MKKTLWINGQSTGANMGKKRREGVSRYPSGQIVHEEREKAETSLEVVATVMAQRVKEVGAPHAGKYEAGFELGRAYLRNQITRQQLKAGEQWAQDVDRYCRLHGYPSPFPKAMDFLSVRGGPSALEPSADEVRVTSNTYMRALTAIGAKGRGAEVACRSLCVENTDPRAWPFHTWQALRAGLSALASLYDIHDFVEKDEKAA
jgi:hypothetical protein